MQWKIKIITIFEIKISALMVVLKHNISLFKSNSQIPIIKVYLNYLLFNIEPVIMFKFMCSTILVLHLVSNNNGEIDKKKLRIIDTTWLLLSVTVRLNMAILTYYETVSQMLVSTWVKPRSTDPHRSWVRILRGLMFSLHVIAVKS